MTSVVVVIGGVYMAAVGALATAAKTTSSTASSATTGGAASPLPSAKAIRRACQSTPSKIFVGNSPNDPFSWGDASNWQPSGAPEPTDAVLIANASIVQLHGPVAPGNVVMVDSVCVSGTYSMLLIHGDFSVTSAFEMRDSALVAAEPRASAWPNDESNPTVTLSASARLSSGARLSLASMTLRDTNLVVEIAVGGDGEPAHSEQEEVTGRRRRRYGDTQRGGVGRTGGRRSRRESRSQLEESDATAVSLGCAGNQYAPATQFNLTLVQSTISFVASTTSASSSSRGGSPSGNDALRLRLKPLVNSRGDLWRRLAFEFFMNPSGGTAETTSPPSPPLGPLMLWSDQSTYGSNPYGYQCAIRFRQGTTLNWNQAPAASAFVSLHRFVVLDVDAASSPLSIPEGVFVAPTEDGPTLLYSGSSLVIETLTSTNASWVAVGVLPSANYDGHLHIGTLSVPDETILVVGAPPNQPECVVDQVDPTAPTTLTIVALPSSTEIAVGGYNVLQLLASAPPLTVTLSCGSLKLPASNNAPPGTAATISVVLGQMSVWVPPVPVGGVACLVPLTARKSQDGNDGSAASWACLINSTNVYGGALLLATEAAPSESSVRHVATPTHAVAKVHESKDDRREKAPTDDLHHDHPLRADAMGPTFLVESIAMTGTAHLWMLSASPSPSSTPLILSTTIVANQLTFVQGVGGQFQESKVGCRSPSLLKSRRPSQQTSPSVSVLPTPSSSHPQGGRGGRGGGRHTSLTTRGGTPPSSWRAPTSPPPPSSSCTVQVLDSLSFDQNPTQQMERRFSLSGNASFLYGPSSSSSSSYSTPSPAVFNVWVSNQVHVRLTDGSMFAPAADSGPDAPLFNVIVSTALLQGWLQIEAGVGSDGALAWIPTFNMSQSSRYVGPYLPTVENMTVMAPVGTVVETCVQSPGNEAGCNGVSVDVSGGPFRVSFSILAVPPTPPPTPSTTMAPLTTAPPIPTTCDGFNNWAGCTSQAGFQMGCIWCGANQDPMPNASCTGFCFPDNNGSSCCEAPYTTECSLLCPPTTQCMNGINGPLCCPPGSVECGDACCQGQCVTSTGDQPTEYACCNAQTGTQPCTNYNGATCCFSTDVCCSDGNWPHCCPEGTNCDRGSCSVPPPFEQKTTTTAHRN